MFTTSCVNRVTCKSRVPLRGTRVCKSCADQAVNLRAAYAASQEIGK
jgi:hypothetical protein